jgi:ribosome-binding ATPase YchF (GTP1/OBG family)
VAERGWLEAVVEALASGRPARDVPVPEPAADGPRKLAALTSKPVLYVANVAEGEDEAPTALAEHAAARNAGIVAVSARVEAELADLDDAGEARELRGELGIAEAGLDRVIGAAWKLLDLIAFFTADADKEAMARALGRGGSAWEAAGRVHTDIQRRFVRAEVIAWDQLVDAGGYNGARDRGLLRIEGRDYVVADGDVVTVKF